MSKSLRKNGLWDYLESVGVLEHGTDAEIKAAKRAYNREYMLNFKRKQRASKPEYSVNFSKETGEYDRVSHAANRHKMTVSAFIHAATLAYIENKFVVPNSEQVARLEQLLSQCLNEIKTIVHAKERFFWEREQKISAIEKKIEKLETQIDAIFRNPPLLSDQSTIPDKKHQIQ